MTGLHMRRYPLRLCERGQINEFIGRSITNLGYISWYPMRARGLTPVGATATGALKYSTSANICAASHRTPLSDTEVLPLPLPYPRGRLASAILVVFLAYAAPSYDSKNL